MQTKCGRYLRVPLSIKRMLVHRKPHCKILATIHLDLDTRISLSQAISNSLQGPKMSSSRTKKLETRTISRINQFNSEQITLIA